DVPVADPLLITDEADNCTANPVVAFVSDVSDGNTCPETITRTYSITDDCGNSINVTQTITVDDITPPTGTAPANVTVECIADVPVADPLLITDEADNCTANPVVAFVSDVSDGNTCPETITRTYSITDDCGNSINVTQTITVDDITPPTGTAPANVTVECIADVPVADPLLITDEADNCTANPVVAFVSDVSDGNTCPETITRTYSITDDCGNVTTVTQTIIVDDITPPTGTAPANVTVECIADVPVADPLLITDEADNCTANPVVAFVSDVSDGNTCPETITRTYSITDDCGNVTTVTQTITVDDTTPPTASNPSDINLPGGSAPAPDPSVVIDEADNCTVNPVVAFVSDVSDGGVCPETITRTYSVTDDCGNQITVVQLIIIGDSIPPTGTAPADITVECIGDVPAPDPLLITDEADNGGPPTVAWESDVSDGNTCPETITRTYSITDDCGNVIFVTQLITVDDITPPTGTAPANVTVECIADVPVADPLLITDEADNCTANPVVAFVSDVSDGNTCPETITRTYSITDDCGNSINVTQTITVDDITPPTGTAPANVTVECIADVPVADPLLITDEADNCTANPVVAFVSDVS
ncbi:MAG: gliding motility-associated C-terminal domain-containing protein, partial [Crocinitomicaceae bacterium]|nr:gliding motility-associated C-terminal domain-containing protein [Crocinitomicaceae bacterium]